MDDDRTAPLVSALVGDEHRVLYLSDAGFHYGIDFLARLLLLWVDAIAADTEEGAQERATAIRDLSARPVDPTFLGTGDR